MAVHIYGHPVDMKGIASHRRTSRPAGRSKTSPKPSASEYKGKKCGGFGRVSCTSFYANKLISTGEGGMCLTDDEKLAETMRRLRNLAFVPEQRFVHQELGFNFRMTNIQAAIGLGQLESFKCRLQKKIAMAARYRSSAGRPGTARPDRLCRRSGREPSTATGCSASC